MNTKRISSAIYLPRPSIRSYHQAICHQVVPYLPSGRTLRPYVIKSHHQTLAFTLPPVLTLIQHCCITKSLGSQICQRNRIKLPLLRVFCQLPPIVNALEQHWMLPTSLAEESNRYQGARRCCVQHAVWLGLVTEVLRLVLFYRLFSICKTMRLFGSRWIQTRKG